jgi:hypothetical protein
MNRVLITVGIAVVILGAGCGRQPAKSGKTAGPAPAAEAAVDGIPSALGPLRFERREGAVPPQYRVTSTEDSTVGFQASASMLQSILGNAQVPEDLRIKAVLAAARLTAGMPPVVAPVPAPVAGWTEPQRLRSGRRGAVMASPDPRDSAYALLTTTSGTWRLPAGVALGVVNDSRLDEAGKIEALLTYPAAVRLPDEAPQRAP